MRRRVLIAAGAAVLPLAPAALGSQAAVRPAPPAPAVADTTRPRVGVHERAEAHAARGVRVCAGGDVSLGTNADTSWAIRATAQWGRPVPALPSPAGLLRPLRPLLRGADVVLLNIEGAIGDGAAPTKCGPTSTACFALRMPIAAAAALRAVNDSAVVVGNVANNHARDAGLEGLDSTIAHLAAAGVQVTGADTLATVVETAFGDTLAILGFSTSGVPDARDLDAGRRHVARAAERYPRVIVTMHLGAEGRDAQRTRDSTERYYGGLRGNPVQFADAALESGADLVIGHGPHVVRAMRLRDGRLVAYSLGNLVTYGPFSLRPPLDNGGILCALLADSGRVKSARFHATRQVPPGRVHADRSGRAAHLADSLSRLDFPRDGARVLGDGTILPHRASRRPRGSPVARPVAERERKP